MKVRIAITAPVPTDYIPRSIARSWNVETISDFAYRFYKNGQLVIGNVEIPAPNWTPHNRYVATFDAVDPHMCPHYESAFVVGALSHEIGSVHNVLVDTITDDADPLENPRGVMWYIKQRDTVKMNETNEHVLSPLVERYAALAARAKTVARQCCDGCYYKKEECQETCSVLLLKQEINLVSKCNE